MTTPTELSRRFRADQIGIARDTARRLIEVSGALNLRAVDESAPGWLAAVEPIVAEQHQRSAEVGNTYYQAQRVASGVTVEAPAPVAVTLDRDGLRGGLVLSGPYAAKKSMSLGADIPTVYQTVLSYSSGVAIRAALAGGRETVQRLAINDARCTGYVRMTGSKPCAFCALIAGNTYYTRQSASSAYHTHCQCVPVPIFGRQSFPTGLEEDLNTYRDLYLEAAAAGGTDKDIESRFFAAFNARFKTS